MSFPEATPHDLPLQIAEDLFVVYGSIQAGDSQRFTRNMAIVRHGSDLTLINAVRMNEAGLKELDALGDVKHVLKLGPLHAMDDPFYVDRYQAEYWSMPGGTTYTEPKPDHLLTDDGLPFPDADLIAFGHMHQPEGVILLRRSPGILLTVDSIQSYSTPPHKPHTTPAALERLKQVGFPDETIIGPIWMQIAVTDRDGMKEQFRHLLTLDFDQLLSAHGVFLASNAKAEVQRAFDNMFSE